MSVLPVVHVDKVLTNFAVGFQPRGFIAEDVFPIITVGKQRDMYNTWEQADFFRAEEDKRAPGTEPSRIRLRVTSDFYYAENYALGFDVTKEDRANADAAQLLMMGQGAITTIKNKLLLGQEKRLATLLFTAGNIGSNAAVSSVWTGAGADPVGDINTAIDNVQHSTGYRPNKMLLGVKSWLALQRHTSIIDKSVNPNVTGGGRGYPTVKEVAELFNLDSIHVGMAYENTAQEDLATANAPVWSNHCLVYHDPPGSLIDQPRLGALFSWTAVNPRFAVIRHPMDSKTKSQLVSQDYYQDEKIVAAAMGFILTGATTN